MMRNSGLMVLAWVAWLSFAIPIYSHAEIPSARILFFAPHPDDEMLGMGGAIWKARHSADPNSDYRIVIFTCGDGFSDAMNAWLKSGHARDLDGDGEITYLDLGYSRRAESLSALKTLGVPSEKVVFLGFPDGGLRKLSQSDQAPYQSPQTHAIAVPYAFARRPGAPFTVESLVSVLSELLDDFKPNVVYTPTLSDEHPDHLETREFVKMALDGSGLSPEHWEYLIHWNHREPSWPHPTADWTFPLDHISPDRKDRLADAGWSRAAKVRALRLYRTQMAVVRDFLIHFAKDTELFWKSRPKISDYLKSPPKSQFQSD